jgi:hypothetical protein
MLQSYVILQIQTAKCQYKMANVGLGWIKEIAHPD